MLSFGWSEITLIFVVIIIVIGPKEIPNFLRQIGNLSKSLKKASREFKKSLSDIADESDLKEIKKSINDISDLKDAVDPSKQLKEEIKSIKDTVNFTDKELKDINDKILQDNK